MAGEDERDLQAGGGYACPAGGGEHPVPAFLHDLIRPRGGSSRPTRRACHAGAWHADPPLPASPATGLLTGLLWTSMWIACAKPHHACAYTVEKLGIAPPGHAHEMASNRQNTTRTPCMQIKTGIVHTPRRKAHNIDGMFIRP